MTSPPQHSFGWVLLLATTAVVGCRAETLDGCRHLDDCPTGSYCRLGECVPIPEGDATGRTGDGTGRRNPGRAIDGTSTVSADGRRTSEGDSGRTKCPDGKRPTESRVALNEILPNVPTGPTGDSNGDGTRDAFEDEFVEIVNRSNTTVDLRGARLVEGEETITRIGTACLKPGGVLLVFGGIADGSRPNVPSGIEARVSQNRLGFSNSGGTFRILGPNGTEITSFSWKSAPEASYTLSPQIDGSELSVHTKVTDGRAMSPGLCADGGTLTDGCSSTESGADAGRTDVHASP